MRECIPRNNNKMSTPQIAVSGSLTRTARRDGNRARRSSCADQVPLYLCVATIPIQDCFPSIGGLSIATLAYCIAAVWMIACRRIVISRGPHVRPTLCFLVFLVFITAVEAWHPYSDYGEITRCVKFFVGTLLIYWYAKSFGLLDKLYTSIVATSIALSILLIVFCRGVLSESAGVGEEIRVAYASSLPLRFNSNELAAFVAMGVVICFVRAMSGMNSRRLNWVLFGVSMLALLTTLSRSGILVAFFGVLCYLAFFHRRLKTMVGLALVVLTLFCVFGVPEEIQRRFRDVGKERYAVDKIIFTRTHVYKQLTKSCLHEFWLGVGYGNYHTRWAMENSMAMYKWESGKYVAVGAHSVPLHLGICWGAFAVVLYSIFCREVLRGLPPLRALTLNGRTAVVLASSAAVLLLFTHNVAGKEFTLVVAAIFCASDEFKMSRALRRRTTGLSAAKNRETSVCLSQ